MALLLRQPLIVAFIAAPVFISEVSPPSMRGELNTTFDVAINGGILIGYVASYLVQVIMPTEWNWNNWWEWSWVHQSKVDNV